MFMWLFVTAFSLADFERETGNMQVIGSRDILSKKQIMTNGTKHTSVAYVYKQSKL